MQDHQKRVIDEKKELDQRLTKLRAFLNTSLFECLNSAEKECLSRQNLIMSEYSRILGERIALFQA